MIFGSIHPTEIALKQPIHPYLLSLLDDAHVDATPRRKEPNAGGRHLLAIEPIEPPQPDPRDLSQRIHFMGALDDPDFLAGMAICDAAVFPYLEVGQSASGPVSLALELGRRIIASRNHTFLEFAACHPDAVEFFDIGNHLELANRILARPQFAARRERSRYTVESNKAVYLAANSAPVAAAPQFRRRATIAARGNREIG